MNPRLRFKRDDETDYPDWEEKKFNDVFDCFEYGLNASATKYDGKNKYIRITDIDEEARTYSYNDVVSPNCELDDKYLVKENDILFARTGASVGKTYLYRKSDGILYFAGFLIRGHVNQKFDSRFIFQSTLSEEFKIWIKVNSVRTGQPGINSQQYASYKLHIPCLEEQEKIADFLSDIDEVILASDQEVKKLQELKKGAMQKIFSQEVRFKRDDGTDYPDWEEKKLGDICNSFSGGTPRTGIDEYYNGNINFIRSGEIHDSKTELFISEEGLKNSSAKIVNVGDILLALYGATSGEIDLSKINGAINQAILCIRPQEGFNKKFIVEIFRYNKNNILKFYLQGGQGNLSAQNILKLNFPFPCLEEQQKIGDFLSDFDEAISLAKQELEKWKLLKKGLLQQMFV